MIKPNKFLDINNSIIKISSDIIKILLKDKVIKYNNLYNQIIVKNGENSKYVFINALDFLYLFNKINYDSNNDTLELNI